MLQTVASGLQELKEDVVFVGGAVAELYASDPASSDIRPTKDVDYVVEFSTRSDYHRFEGNLRSKGFTNDTSSGAPICRWVYNGIKVDAMPTDPAILGFSNMWYTEGIENKISKVLPDGSEIFVFRPEYYLAAKFEAHNDRGGDDLRQSQDFEDIIYILDNCTTILEDIYEANQSVKDYLISTCKDLIDNEDLLEGIESALAYGSDSDSVERIEEIISSIAKFE